MAKDYLEFKSPYQASLIGTTIAGRLQNGVLMSVVVGEVNFTPDSNIDFHVSALGKETVYTYLPNEIPALRYQLMNETVESGFVCGPPYIGGLYQINSYTEAHPADYVPTAPAGDYDVEIRMWFEDRLNRYKGSSTEVLKLHVTSGATSEDTGTVSFISSTVEPPDSREPLTAPEISIQGVNVSISQAEGGSVWYTTDGTDPVPGPNPEAEIVNLISEFAEYSERITTQPNGTYYESPFVIEETSIIKARATDYTGEYKDSDIAVYEAVPTPEPVSGPFSVKRLSQLPNLKNEKIDISTCKLLIEKDSNLYQLPYSFLMSMMAVSYSSWGCVYSDSTRDRESFNVFYNREMKKYVITFNYAERIRITDFFEFGSVSSGGGVVSTGSAITFSSKFSAESSQHIADSFLVKGRLIGKEYNDNQNIYVCDNWISLDTFDYGTWTVLKTLPEGENLYQISPFGEDSIIYSTSNSSVSQFKVYIYNISTQTETLFNEQFSSFNNYQNIVGLNNYEEDGFAIACMKLDGVTMSCSGKVYYTSNYDTWIESPDLNNFYINFYINRFGGRFYATRIADIENMTSPTDGELLSSEDLINWRKESKDLATVAVNYYDFNYPPFLPIGLSLSNRDGNGIHRCRNYFYSGGTRISSINNSETMEDEVKEEFVIYAKQVLF